MTAYINKLKDKTGNQQLPVTHERAVRDDNGTTAETKFQNLEGAMDKAYVASSDNGMGRITLKKNMVSGVNTLTQSMMQATNTIYVIRYDFTLGEDITVPANCVLEFDGGSIIGNGTGKDTITGSNSSYVTKYFNKVLFNNITFAGTWVQNEIYDSCFNYTTGTAFFANLAVLSESDILTNIYINKNYNVNPWCYDIQSNSNIVLEGTISLIPNNNTDAVIWYADDRKNIKISGNGNIIGDCEDHDYSSGGTHEYGHGIRVRNCENVIISGIHISYCTGDGIDIAATYSGYNSKNVTIIGVESSYNRRNNISISGANGVVIKDCHIHHAGKSSVGGTAPMTGIDFEDNHEGEGIGNYNCFVTNCYIHDNASIYGCIEFVDVNKNITIDNVNSDSGILVQSSNHEHITIQNSTFSQIYLNIWNKKVNVVNCRLGGIFITPQSPGVFEQCTIDDSITTTISTTYLINYVSKTDDYKYLLEVKRCDLRTNTKELTEAPTSFSNDSKVELSYCNITGLFEMVYITDIHNCFVNETKGGRFMPTYKGKEIKIIENTFIGIRPNGGPIYLNVATGFNDSTITFIGNKVISLGNIEVLNSAVLNTLTMVDNVLFSAVSGKQEDHLVRSNVASTTNLIFISNEVRYSTYGTKPTLGNRDRGNMIFDPDDNNKPKWWNGTAWVDATGTPV